MNELVPRFAERLWRATVFCFVTEAERDEEAGAFGVLARDVIGLRVGESARRRSALALGAPPVFHGMLLVISSTSLARLIRVHWLHEISSVVKGCPRVRGSNEV